MSLGRPLRGIGPALLVAALLAAGSDACRDDRSRLGERGFEGAAPGPRGVVVLQSKWLGVGEVGEVVIAVQTDAHHRVLPWTPPELKHIEVVSLEEELEELQGDRWLHRTRIRLRALESGEFSWPALSLVIEAPSGEQVALELPAQPFEVRSLLKSQHVDRQPYGLRRFEEPRRRGFTSGLLVGASCAALFTWLLLRRKGASAKTPPAPKPSAASTPMRSAEDTARDELLRARMAVAESPRRASNIGAAALRAFVSKRFTTTVLAETTVELKRARPSVVPPEHWSEFVRILQRYDADRFQPHAAAEGEREHVEACLSETERFIDDSSSDRMRAR